MFSALFASAASAIVINSFRQFENTNFAQESYVTFGSFDFPPNKALDVTFKNGATVKFTGKITFQKGDWSIEQYLVVFHGDNLKISGGIFDGNGHLYWDGKGMHSNKPKFFEIETTNSYYSDMTIINAPVFMVQVHNDGNTFDGLVLEARGSKPQTKNTDGFDISANNIVIKNTIVTNQDDCVAINKGSNIVIENMKCINGHGISIGSIRKGAVVDNVRITKSQVFDSQQGFRIKGWYNNKGTVKNVLVDGLEMTRITKGGVVIIQDYAGGPQAGKIVDGFDIVYDNITLKNVVGSVVGKKAKTMNIFCAKGHCNKMDIFSGVRITGGASVVNLEAQKSSGSSSANSKKTKKEKKPKKNKN